MPLSALSGQDLTVPRRVLVARRQLRLLDENLLHPDGQLILARRPGPLVSVEVGLRADVLEALRDEPVLLEEGIEGVDVRFDGGLERRVCRVIGGGIAEEMFATQSIEVRRPLGVCSTLLRFYGRHLE